MEQPSSYNKHIVNRLALQIFYTQWLKATEHLQPVNMNKSKCVIMTVMFQKQPFWIQVPCVAAITGNWVCKRELTNLSIFVNIKLANNLNLSSSICLGDQYMCGDQTCIVDKSVCDGVPDCSHGEDEQQCGCQKAGQWIYNSAICYTSCHKDNYTCGLLYHNDNGCTPYSHRNHHFKEIHLFQCSDGQQIPLVYVNDTVPDCLNGEDELEHKDLLIGKVVSTRCVSGNYPCVEGHSFCYNQSKTCIYDLDEFGYLKYCRNGKHLEDCKNVDCRALNMYKCKESYCIPNIKVCDNVIDCIDGDDEDGCNNYTKTLVGMLLCKKHSLHVHPNKVCDAVVDCPYGDDESICNINHCPSICDCLALGMICNYTNLTYIPLYTKHLQYLLFQGNILHVDTHTFGEYQALQHLHLANNGLKQICQETINQNKYLRTLFKLNYLDLSHNHISHLAENCFGDLQSLKILKLEYNSIKLLNRNTFLGLQHLQVLNLSYNEIYTLGAHVFDGLTNIYHIELQGNILSMIDAHAIHSLPPFHTIIADHFRICCLTTQIINCITPKQLLSSCTSLLKYTVFQIWIWTVSIICIIMNTSVLLLQHMRRRLFAKFEPLTFMICQLAYSNMLYGIYLLVIAVTDLLLSGNYSVHYLEWRSSITCHISAILASISIVVSVIILVFITALRHGIITNPHRETFWHSRFKVYTLMFLTWITAICSMSAVIGFFWWASKGTFLQPNGLCIIFMSDMALPGNLAINLTLNFVLLVAMVLIISFYCKLYIYNKRKRMHLSHMRKTANARNQKKRHLPFTIWLITATNIVCWIAVVVASILQVVVDQNVMDATVIIVLFILPINSTLNPIIYSFKTCAIRRKPLKERDSISHANMGTNISDIELTN